MFLCATIRNIYYYFLKFCLFLYTSNSSCLNKRVFFYLLTTRTHTHTHPRTHVYLHNIDTLVRCHIAADRDKDHFRERPKVIKINIHLVTAISLGYRYTVHWWNATHHWPLNWIYRFPASLITAKYLELKFNNTRE